jgi:hypothetical protein
MLKNPTVSPYPEEDESNVQLPTLFLKIHFNIILLFMPG